MNRNIFDILSGAIAALKDENYCDLDLVINASPNSGCLTNEGVVDDDINIIEEASLLRDTLSTKDVATQGNPDANSSRKPPIQKSVGKRVLKNLYHFSR